MGFSGNGRASRVWKGEKDGRVAPEVLPTRGVGYFFACPLRAALSDTHG